MENFKNAKDQLLKLAKEKNACSDQYKRAYSAETPQELLKVVYDNLNWCSNNKVITNTWLNLFPADILLESGCANTGIENTGFGNSGDRNSGYWNSGYRNSGDGNSGYRNSGDSNSGDSNSGDWNSGYRNSGNWNSGYRNSGNGNSGNWNSGNWNSGYRNSGDGNSGDSNSGDWNSGDRNSGYWNSGYRNSGDSNSGYRNSGAFCTDNSPKMILFNKPCKTMTVRDWENSRAYFIMRNLETHIWVQSNIMTDAEKENNKSHEITGGYLKIISLKDAWANLWGNLTDENKAVFTSLENFDAAIFEEITGIKTN